MVSHYPAKFGDHGHSGKGHEAFLLLHDFARQPDLRAMQVYGKNPLMIL